MRHSLAYSLPLYCKGGAKENESKPDFMELHAQTWSKHKICRHGSLLRKKLAG